MKAAYTKTLARRVLLAFVVFIIVLSIAALFVRYTIAKKAEDISKTANNVEVDSSKPEQALLLLHESENDFQESLSNVNSQKRSDYKIKLSQAFDKIGTLLQERADTAQLTPAQNNKIKLWYQKKLKLSDKLYILKHNFDSLLTVYANFNKETDANLNGAATNINISSRSSKNHNDTTRKIINTQKKGLFGRIKDAIVNKKNESGSVNVKHNTTNYITDLNTQKILARNKNAYSKKLQELQQRNMSMLDKQRELIMLNTNISNELERIINDVKEINYNMAYEFKKMALKNYQETVALLNDFFLVALFLILIFAILLIIFIFQLNTSEQFLLKENERSVAMAQQKMDLLLHMSHEIRNPLTAIKGFLYIFSRSSLSQRQTEMLDSIRFSSDMLLQTLNDTLDAAKMETNEFKINSDPFNPDFMLNAAIESMEFSAARKNLIISYNFKGDKQAIVLGDSFRLKQVMINLLSNAIKYTNKGSITVTAELINDGNRLQVDVIDTGVGISLEQQTRLFSKYYQTSSSKGSIGTGLGLFICKQLIEMQGGKINVKSNTDAGSTFSFSIPYKSGTNSLVVKQDTDDPLVVLNGVSILAVDDNELGLMFLKLVMSKWNMKFHQASNGKEALEILSKEEIILVLTDLHMPEMDGYELLAAIRKLSRPLNKLPVIVITGASQPVEVEKMLKAGFSGVVSKPILKNELADELVKVVKKQLNVENFA